MILSTTNKNRKGSNSVLGVKTHLCSHTAAEGQLMKIIDWKSQVFLRKQWLSKHLQIKCPNIFFFLFLIHSDHVLFRISFKVYNIRWMVLERKCNCQNITHCLHCFHVSQKTVQDNYNVLIILTKCIFNKLKLFKYVAWLKKRAFIIYGFCNSHTVAK